jgi:hypothetical protein
MWQDDVFQVERYEIVIQVRPTVKEEVLVRHGSKQRLMRCDNRAEIRRQVRFAQTNSRSDPFTLRYATRGEGFIYPPVHLPPINEASPAELGRYHDQGKEITWRFTPCAGSPYSQSFAILGGFPPGDRTAHFHLHDKTRYETIVVTLDLSQYVDQGYPVIEGPHLHFHQDDPQDHNLCQLRGLGHVAKPCHIQKGKWTWQILRVNEGVIDVVWDVNGPEKQLPASDPNGELCQALLRENLTACQVFEVVMRIMERKAVPVSFRQVKTLAEGIVPKTGIGSDLPLSQPQISRYISDVEKMLQEDVFFGSSVLLFEREPGRASIPTPMAQKAVDMIRRYLATLDLTGRKG